MSLLIRNRNFRLLFGATSISNLGDGISALAFPWLATLMTRDPVLISLVAAAGRAPWLLISLPAGVWNDRLDRQRLMVWSDLVRCVLTLCVIGLILSAGNLDVAEAQGAVIGLAGLAFLLGVAEVLRDNAAQTALPSIVEKPDLERANGQLWTAEQVLGQFVGPPLAGFLIALALPLPFFFDAVSFVLAAALVALITFPPRTAPARRAFWAELREGVAWMRARPLILRLAVTLGLMNALHMMSLTVLVLFGQEVLSLNAAQYGVLLTASAAGGVAGGLLGPGIVDRIGPRRGLFVALLLFPIPFFVLALTSSALLTGAALFAEMFAALLWNIITVSYRQREIPDDLLGRVNSIYRFFGWGMIPFGALAAGGVMATLEPSLGRELALRANFAIPAAAFVCILIWGLFALRIPDKKETRQKAGQS